VNRFPSLPYVGPFCVFLILLVLSKAVPWPPLMMQAGFATVMLAVIGVAFPGVMTSGDEWRVHNWAGTLLLGAGVFVLWISPDLLFPGYHHFWLFENAVMGKAATSLSAGSQSQPAVLWLRAFRAVAIVPFIEEIFWRGWLMRWIVSSKFKSVPLGTWSAQAFWVVALLFASEHGPYWDVGLAAGVLYNWWMVRTRSLGDLVLAHAVTNACLSGYVVWSGRWEYWL